MREKFLSYRRNSIELTIGGEVTGCSYFGGEPMLPANFEYPTFVTSTFYDDEEKPRPLHFVAQLDCARVHEYDSQSLLPDHGILSFFYECDSMRWGFSPTDRGCARVYWFEKSEELQKTAHPAYEWEHERFEPLGIGFAKADSYPDGADFEYLCKDIDYDDYDRLRAEFDPYPNNRHKLLGWADVIQNSMPIECELVSRGYDLGSGSPKLPDRSEIARAALDEWLLLFQLDTVDNKDGQLMFGDCGRIYYYIKREDLAARRFDRVWLVLQCG